jgi:hypothetical protein
MFTPYIKIVAVPNPSEKVTHHVIVNIVSKLEKHEKILIEVSNRVYETKNNVADVKIIKPFNLNAIKNNELPDVQVRACVYNSLEDKITIAYCQLFEYSNILKNLKPSDDIRKAVPNLISDWSKFRVKKIEKKTIKVTQNNTKTKVHFTIGMFFDGTGNNRFNSEEIYYKKLNDDNLVYICAPRKKII